MIQNPSSDSSRIQGGNSSPHISAHADYRHGDYFFARKQSRAMEALEWQDGDGGESRSLGPGLIVTVVLLVISGLGFMLWEESRLHSGTDGTHRPLIERSSAHLDLAPNHFPLADALLPSKG